MNYREARMLAAREALAVLGSFYSGPEEAVLDEEFLEAEHCWMFFRNRNIALPKSSLLDLAFVYGKSGGARDVPDLRGQPEELEAYLQRLSALFSE